MDAIINTIYFGETHLYAQLQDNIDNLYSYNDMSFWQDVKLFEDIEKNSNLIFLIIDSILDKEKILAFIKTCRAKNPPVLLPVIITDIEYSSIFSSIECDAVFLASNADDITRFVGSIRETIRQDKTLVNLDFADVAMVLKNKSVMSFNASFDTKDNEPLNDIAETLAKISAIIGENGHYALLLDIKGSGKVSLKEMNNYTSQFSNGVLPNVSIFSGLSVSDAAKDGQVDMFIAFSTVENIYNRDFVEISGNSYSIYDIVTLDESIFLDDEQISLFELYMRLDNGDAAVCSYCNEPYPSDKLLFRDGDHFVEESKLFSTPYYTECICESCLQKNTIFDEISEEYIAEDSENIVELDDGTLTHIDNCDSCSICDKHYHPDSDELTLFGADTLCPECVDKVNALFNEWFNDKSPLKSDFKAKYPRLMQSISTLVNTDSDVKKMMNKIELLMKDFGKKKINEKEYLAAAKRPAMTLQDKISEVIIKYLES